MNAAEIYAGSDGEATKALYALLETRGPLGHIAMNLFRAQKCSERAKAYRGGNSRGRYRDQAYERKGWSMGLLVKALHEHAESIWDRVGLGRGRGRGVLHLGPLRRTADRPGELSRPGPIGKAGPRQHGDPPLRPPVGWREERERAEDRLLGPDHHRCTVNDTDEKKPSTPDPEDPTDKILHLHVNQLMEHFDTVHIFVTKFQREGNPDATTNGHWGRGNWFARYGQIIRWLRRTDHDDLHEEES